VLPQGGGASIAVEAITVHNAPFDYCQYPPTGAGQSASDMAVLTLASAIPSSLIDPLTYPIPFPASDVFAQQNGMLVSIPGATDVQFHQCGFGGTVEFNSATGSGVRHCGIPEAGMSTDSSSEPAGDGTYLETTLDYGGDPGATGTTHANNDSGGGLFLQAVDATGAHLGNAILVGVIQGWTQYTLDDDQTFTLTGDLLIQDHFGSGVTTKNYSLIAAAPH
jgi:hypothetical protein